MYVMSYLQRRAVIVGFSVSLLLLYIQNKNQWQPIGIDIIRSVEK